MKYFAAFLALAAMVACAQVDPDTYQPVGSTYGRSDGWFVDSSGNWQQMVNGSATGTYLTSAGAIVNVGAQSFGGDITLENSGTIKNDNNNEIELGEGAEDLAFGFSGTNVVDLSSDTGVVGLDLAAVGTTLTLANDQTIVSDTDTEIQIGDAGEDISFGFSTNTCTLSSDTGVVALDMGAVSTTITYANGATLGTGTAEKLTWTENSEDITWEFKTDELELSSSTGVATYDRGALNLVGTGTLQVLGSGATIGWAAASAGNTACATTCAGTGACVFGYDVGGAVLVACDSADADTCMCAGPAS